MYVIKEGSCALKCSIQNKPDCVFKCKRKLRFSTGEKLRDFGCKCESLKRAFVLLEEVRQM